MSLLCGRPHHIQYSFVWIKVQVTGEIYAKEFKKWKRLRKKERSYLTGANFRGILEKICEAESGGMEMGELTSAMLRQLMDCEGLQVVFDEVRLMEVATGSLFDLKDGSLVPNGRKCYTRWNHCGLCRNCVARKASDQGKRTVKFEYHDGNYYMVIAQPLRLGCGAYALELITNITERVVTEEGFAQKETFIHDLTAQLETISEHEAFTGLYSKAYLARDIEARLNGPDRRSLYLAVFDVDDFRYINDFYGNVQGDAVLQKFSELLSHALVGRQGYAARVDGDEFALVLDAEDPAACADLARQLKEEFSAHVFRVAEMKFRASVSIGVVEISAAANFEQALEWARLRRKADAKPGNE